MTHPEPRVKRNGRCRVCNGERGKVAKLHLDPFCSTACAKLYFDTETVLRGRG